MPSSASPTPLAGSGSGRDAFDAVFKSHRRNFALLHKEYAPMLAPIGVRRRAPLWLRVGGALMVAAIGYGLWHWLLR